MPTLPAACAPHRLSAAEASRAIREGRLSSEALVRSCLERIAQREPALQAWAALDAEGAIAAARALDAGPPRGPLHGVPVGIKDVIDSAGLPTGYNSPIYRGHVAAADAEVVRRARRAGLVVIGKTATQEFATRGDAGPTRHPHSAAHSPGGSSSGSAAAVADGMVPLAISTQTAGSIVRPASYCGVVGLKPGFGLIDTAGLRRLVPSFDALGVHARSVADAALALDALSDWGGLPAFQRGPGPDSDLRLAVCGLPCWPLASAAARQALDEAVTRLTAAGVRIEARALPQVFDALNAAHDTVSDWEARQTLDAEWQTQRAMLSAGVQAKLRRGEAVGAQALAQARETIARCRAALGEVFAGCDALLTLAAPDVAPPFSRTETGDSAFNKPWSTLGVPSINVPMPVAGRLPIGIQLAAAPGCDTQLLLAAAQVQRLLPATPSST
jgi:Asp-tRNA(Asn)/Glu-tRNA(Gln) amidotransferase A subunit family amidase